MEEFPIAKSQIIALRIDTASKVVSGWTELVVHVKVDAKELALHAYGLDITSVHLADEPAAFSVNRSKSVEDKLAATLEQQHHLHQLPTQHEVNQVFGDAARQQYEHSLQAGLSPELVISLPPLSAAAANVAEPSRQLSQQTTKGGDTEMKTANEGAAADTTTTSVNILSTKVVSLKKQPPRIVPLKIEYQVRSPVAGVHFFGNYAVTDNEVRRASAWVPCIDTPSASVAFELQLTVASPHTAVGPGQLVKQTWVDRQQKWKTFYYDVTQTCAPCELGFAVGPFQAFPARAGETSLALAPPPPPPPPLLPSPTPAVNGVNIDLTVSQGGGNGSQMEISQSPPPPPPPVAVKPIAVTLFSPPMPRSSSSISTYTKQQEEIHFGDMAHTCKFFTLPCALFSEVLASKFPLPAMQHVFLPPEMTRVECATYQGLQVLSTDAIIRPHSVEQSQAARCAIAGALAQQWFGHFLRPATIDDAWLVEGLAGWLQDQFIKKYMGRTEVLFHQWQRRQQVAAADNGDAPPLAFRLNAAVNAGRPPVNSPWGPLLGSESLDPSPLRSLKSAAVVAMVERRAGEDLFRKHVEALVAAATKSPDARFVHSFQFLSEIGRAGDFLKEVGAFAERWVYGRGVPQLTLGYRFYRRGCYMEVGIHQTGSAPAKIAAESAELAAQREGIGTGIIKVAVKEGSGATVEHPVHVGAESVVIAEIKVNPEVKRVALKRGRRRKNEEEIVAAAQRAAENAMHPVQWVRLDPGGEWLCSGRVVQVERTLRNQLFDSKDVVAQIEAVQGLGDIPVSVVSTEALGLLEDALYNRHRGQTTHLHCRVRIEAARALASLKCEGSIPLGLVVLSKYYHEHYWDGTDLTDASKSMKSCNFGDVGEYLVAKAVVASIASVTQVPKWRASFEATQMMTDTVGLLCDSLDGFYSSTNSSNSTHSTYDDAGLLATLCCALGDAQISLGDEDDLGHFMAYDVVVNKLRRRLDAELVSPSAGFIVGKACLDGMVMVVANRNTSGRAASAASEEGPQIVRDVLQSYCGRSIPFPLRKAAYRAFTRFLAGHHSWSAALQFALHCTETAGDVAGDVVALAVWEEVAIIAPAAAAAGQAVDPLALLKVVEIVKEFSDCRIQHLAFVTLRRLQQQPPTLFVPQDERVLLQYQEEAQAMATMVQQQQQQQQQQQVSAVPVAVSQKFSLTAAAAAPSAQNIQTSAGAAPSMFTGVQEKSIKLKMVMGGTAPSDGDGGGALPAVTLISDGRAPGGQTTTLATGGGGGIDAGAVDQVVSSKPKFKLKFGGGAANQQLDTDGGGDISPFVPTIDAEDVALPPVEGHQPVPPPVQSVTAPSAAIDVVGAGDAVVQKEEENDFIDIVGGSDAAALMPSATVTVAPTTVAGVQTTATATTTTTAPVAVEPAAAAAAGASLAKKIKLKIKGTLTSSQPPSAP